MSAITDTISKTVKSAVDYVRGTKEARPSATRNETRPPDGTKVAVEKGRIHDVTQKADGEVSLKASHYPQKTTVTMTPGKGDAPPTFHTNPSDGEIRRLDAEEKQRLASNLDRKLTSQDLKGDERKAAQTMLDGLLRDPEVDARWHAPNQLKDAALGEGRLTSTQKSGEGRALGRKPGPIEELTLTNGNSAEATVYREGAPNGPGSTPLFSKKRDDGHLVALSRDEAVALRDNLQRQGIKDKTLTRDLDRYVRSLDPYSAGDTFEVCSN